MSKYSPKIDLVFRKVFGSEENTDILLSLINAVIESDPPLTEVTINNPYNIATYVGDKTSILDIKAMDAAGDWYDIEIQIGEHGYYEREREIYEAELKARLDDQEELRTAREKGREDQRKDIAHNLLRKGLPIEMIAEVTGLSVVEIDALKPRYLGLDELH